MSELFEDVSADKALIIQEDDIVEAEEVFVEENHQHPIPIDARRRLESLLDEKRLRDELKDFLDD